MSWFSDLFNPPAANVPTPQVNTYNPGSLGSADAAAFGGIGNLGQFNQYGANLGQAQGITQGMISNPYAGDYLTAANTAAQMGQQAATGAFQQGQTLYNQAPVDFNLASTIANTAFDPQQALYNRTLQQTQDQARAANEAAGVGTTPYGAGIENQATDNFNINWQNQQLLRQIQGGQAAGGLIGQGAGLIGQGAALQAGAPGQYYAASGLPYNTAQGIGQNQLGALSALGQYGAAGGQQAQQPIQDYLAYLGWGTGAQNAGNAANLGVGNFQLNQANQGFNQQQQMFGDIGKVIGWGASAFGGGGGIGWGGGGGTPTPMTFQQYGNGNFYPQY